MTRTRILTAAAATIIAVTSLTGCGGVPSTAPDTPNEHSKQAVSTEQNEQGVSTEPSETYPFLIVEQVSLPDGRTVTCVIQDEYQTGGLDCDWDTAQ